MTPHEVVTRRSFGLCELCSAGGRLEQHHIEMKGMGGRNGLVVQESEAPQNLLNLCVPCHHAMHHRLTIIQTGQGLHSCKTCWRLKRCAYGQAVV